MKGCDDCERHQRLHGALVIAMGLCVLVVPFVTETGRVASIATLVAFPVLFAVAYWRRWGAIDRKKE